MARILVVLRKADRRVVFACDPLLPTLFETLWAPTAYSYFTVDVDATTYGKVHNNPQLWEWSDERRNLVLSETPVDLGLEPRKARLLMVLARCVNRQRRVVLKTDLVGQDTVYAMKLAEAEAQQSGGPGPFPLLESEASLSNATVSQVAIMVRFRAAQTAQYLQESEYQRRSFTTRIVLAQNFDELATIETELNRYEVQF